MAIVTGFCFVLYILIIWPLNFIKHKTKQKTRLKVRCFFDDLQFRVKGFFFASKKKNLITKLS